MNPKEKYDNMINTIEEMIVDIKNDKLFMDGDKIIYKGVEIDDDTVNSIDDFIVKSALEAGNNGLLERKSRDGLFSFMTGKPAKKYVDERRMMHVYTMLTDSGFRGMTKEYELADVENQSSFDRKFKKFFGVSPQAVQGKRDYSRIIPMKTWDTISENITQPICEAMQDGGTNIKKFGVDAYAFSNATTACNLQNYYGLNDFEAELAFEIADKNSLDFDEVFEYVYGYVWQYIDPLPEIIDQFGYDVYPKLDPYARDKYIELDLNNRETINLYFKCGFGFKEIRELLFFKAMGKCDFNFKSTEDDLHYALKQYYKKITEEISAMSDEEASTAGLFSNEEDEERFWKNGRYLSDYGYKDWMKYLRLVYEDTWEENYLKKYFAEDEELEKHLELYRGDKTKKMPAGYFDLRVNDKAKKELAAELVLILKDQFSDTISFDVSPDIQDEYNEFCEKISKTSFTIEEILETIKTAESEKIVL